MTKKVNPSIKKEIQSSTLTAAIDRVTQALASEDFGVLSQISMHEHFKNKLGTDLSPVVILGACHTQLAYEAYRCNSDVTSLLPCNAVIREITPGTYSIELSKPSVFMSILNDDRLNRLSTKADHKLALVLEKI